MKLLPCLVLSTLLVTPTYAELRDPTRPPSFTSASIGQPNMTPLPRLRSIVAGGGRKLALINNTYLAEGESRGGVEVIQIGPSNVVVRYAGKEATLTLDAKRVTKEFK